MKKLSLFLLVAVFFLAACGESTVDVWLDNPTYDDVTVDIDGEIHDLEALDNKMIQLSKGEHTFKTTANGEAIAEGSFTVENSGGIVNATGTEYVIWNDIYTNNSEYYDLVDEKSITIDGIDYDGGDFTLISGNTYYIEKDWDFDLMTEWPDTISMDADMEYGFRSKVYAAEDFVYEYDWYYGTDDYEYDAELEALIDSLLQEYDDSVAEYEAMNE